MIALVTGATGFIGLHLCRKLLETGCYVLGLSRSGSSQSIKSLLQNQRFQLVKGNLCDFKTLTDIIKRNSVEAIFHLAAELPHRSNPENPFPPFEVNLRGTLNLLEAAHLNKARHFIYASSIDVYSEPPRYLPVDEEHPANPPTIYGATKLGGEHFCQVYSQSMRVTVLRYSIVYGLGQPQHHAISQFILSALRNEPLTIYGDGQQSNDFVFIKDVIEANLLVLEAGASGIFNIGCGEETSIEKLVREIIRLTQSKSEPIRIARETNKPFRFSLDISRARTILGYSPRSLEEGLSEHIQEIISESRIQS